MSQITPHHLRQVTEEPSATTDKPRTGTRLFSAAELTTMATPSGLPFAIQRTDGSLLTFASILRHLPGKRFVGEARGVEGRVLAKLFIGNAARRHWERETSGLRALGEAGIPTPPVITTEALPDGAYLILTRYMDPATTVSAQLHRLAEAYSDNARSAPLLADCFRLVGQLHASGLMHHDLHPANFLIADGSMMLIDGDAVSGKPHTRLPHDEALANLATLIVQFPMALTLEPTGLLAAYRKRNPELPDDPLGLDSAVWRAREKRTADYLDKAGRNCSRYIVRRSFRTFQIVARDQETALRPLIDDPDHFMATGESLKQGNTATVSGIQLGDTQWVVKRYNIKNLIHGLSRMCRPTRAWHSWLAAHRLQVLGIATPRPVGLLEQRFGPLRSRAWLITGKCLGDNLRDLLDPATPPPPSVGNALVELFLILLAARITHGDLKATNMLWQGGRIHLIDLDALTQHPRNSSFQTGWARDRARLLRNWPAESPLHGWLDAHLPDAGKT